MKHLRNKQTSLGYKIPEVDKYGSFKIYALECIYINFDPGNTPLGLIGWYLDTKDNLTEVECKEWV